MTPTLTRCEALQILIAMLLMLIGALMILHYPIPQKAPLPTCCNVSLTVIPAATPQPTSAMVVTTTPAPQRAPEELVWHPHELSGDTRQLPEPAPAPTEIPMSVSEFPWMGVR